jgi:hypothetical protein
MWVLESLKPIQLNKREAEIVILEEGPGNKARKCWYGVEALESGRDIFRGTQVYSDHPSSSEQQDLPERSVRDLVGRIKETWIAVNPQTGKKQLRGILKINEGRDFDWVASLIKESIKAGEEGFPPVAQVSIHADGDISPKVIEGEKYNYVSNIKSAVSVDIVTKGGIRNSGFVKFMENALGGFSMSTQNDARFRQIQQKLAESLSNDDATFLESYLSEGAVEDMGVEDEGVEGDEYAEEPELFEDEAGNMYAITGETDEYGNPLVMNEAGELMAVGADEFEEDEYADDYADEEYFDDEEEEYAFDGADVEDDVPLADLAERFPALAHEIDMEEMGAMESMRDPDIAALKMENKLLKSRMIAENKLAESALPEGMIPIAELVGKSPEEMDIIIEGRRRLFETVTGMVQGAQAALVEASTGREAGDTAVGLRILRSSLLPS